MTVQDPTREACRPLTLALFEVLVALDRADDESFGIWPSALTVGRYCGRTQRGAINGLLALRSRGLAMDLVGDYGSVDRWAITEEGRAVLGRGPLFR